MAWLTIFALACLLNFSVQRSTPADDSYVAAVLEYQPQGTTALNLANYRRYIQEAAAQNADIIVFPELTLSRGETIDVPVGGRLLEYPIPALNPDIYHEVLVSISDAAIQSQIYVVINIEEFVNCSSAIGEHCPEEIIYRFNTNVVFDRTGAIIDRFRKINLFGERTRTPALTPDLGIFTTDFGVTFGHFICFDLMFQVPALQIVQAANVTDVVFPTMWFSELPYLSAVQIQEAYAFALNVNFLGSGANNVGVGSAGSGIYSGRAGALASTMPGLPTTRLLVARVPKVPGQVSWPVPRPTYDPPSDHDSLVLITDPSVVAHVSRPLVPGLQEFTLTDREVSCWFRINFTVNNPDIAENIYKYRATVFSGVRSYTGVATGGTRVCSVVACTGDTLDTCGKRFPVYNTRKTGIFNELIIVATVPTPVILPSVQAADSQYFPVSVDTSIMPLEPEYYSYSEDVKGNETVYTLSLNDNDFELYTLAVWGRYYPDDGLDDDPPREEVIPEIVTENPVDIVVTGDDGEVTTDSDGEPDAASAHFVSAFLMSVMITLTVGCNNMKLIVQGCAM